MSTGPTQPPPADDPQAGENTCPTCAGSGRTGEGSCATCDGSGVVVETVGDA